MIKNNPINYLIIPAFVLLASCAIPKEKSKVDDAFGDSVANMLNTQNRYSENQGEADETDHISGAQAQKIMEQHMKKTPKKQNTNVLK